MVFVLYVVVCVCVWCVHYRCAVRTRVCVCVLCKFMCSCVVLGYYGVVVCVSVVVATTYVWC